MSKLADQIREQAKYEGPSKGERALWNKAIELACKVVDENQIPGLEELEDQTQEED